MMFDDYYYYDYDHYDRYHMIILGINQDDCGYYDFPDKKLYSQGICCC